MTTLEKIGFSLLAIVFALYVIVLLVGMVAAFPYGLIGLIAFIGVGLLFVQVVRDRLNNEEDDYYSKNVHQ